MLSTVYYPKILLYQISIPCPCAENTRTLLMMMMMMMMMMIEIGAHYVSTAGLEFGFDFFSPHLDEYVFNLISKHM
jgi:hypothetical protein